MTNPMQWALLVFAIFLSISGSTGQSTDKRSLCPQVLAYDSMTPGGTRYTANILLRTDVVLRGFRVSIRFDVPVNLLGNEVGDVETVDNRLFVIKTKKRLEPGPPFSLPIFVTHAYDRVPYIESIKLDRAQICPEGGVVSRSVATVDDEPVFQTKPKRVIVRPGGSVSLLGRVGAPLAFCEFYHAPSYQKIDFRLGAQSPSTRDYEYYGAGLEQGECGITLKNIHDGMDGVIESKIKPLDKPDWVNSATMLRVTAVPKNRLPVFNISPRYADLKIGDNLTVTCNADRLINMCHIYLPGGVYLNLDEGARSTLGNGYRYHGKGLREGNCGVKVTNIDTILNGFVVCKVGMWPEQTTGAWDTDAFKITTVYDDGDDVGVADNSLDVSSESTLSYDVDPRINEDNPVRATTKPPRPTKVTRPQHPDVVECGKTAVSAVPLVTRGQATTKGQWPWHAAIYVSAANGDVNYQCGATLIGKKAVVTAAHCVTTQPFDRPADPATLKVQLGKYHLKEWAENGVQEKRVASVVLHSNYTKSGFLNDIAILTFVTAVDYTEFVRPICLWDRKNTDINSVEGENGTVVGWGINEDGKTQNTLMMVKMPVVSFQTCVWSKATHFLPLLRSTTYCAGFADGTSVCNGDSGGGMIFPTKMRDNSNKWFLRGIVSNSVAKTQAEVANLVCDPFHYVVFTDAAQYLPWITPYSKL